MVPGFSFPGTGFFPGFSTDEGKTWSQPKELPLALTGDRHVGKYAPGERHAGKYLPDLRLFISFRCNSPKAKRPERSFEGDWVGWVGTWDDLVKGREGQYQVRLRDNQHAWDCAYPGVEILPDGTFVTTTYGHWDKGQKPYIRSLRFTLDDLDRYAGELPQ